MDLSAQIVHYVGVHVLHTAAIDHLSGSIDPIDKLVLALQFEADLSMVIISLAIET